MTDRRRAGGGGGRRDADETRVRPCCVSTRRSRVSDGPGCVHAHVVGGDRRDQEVEDRR